MTPAFQGEVQMRRWSDSSTQGVQITFALPDSEALEPLKHKAGKRFMAVLVEIGDDEMPVEQPKRQDTRGPHCREACDLCKLAEFQDWVSLQAGSRAYASEEGAAKYVQASCGISSRLELDSNLTAYSTFVQRIRTPFHRWRRGSANNRAQDRATQ